MTRPSPMLRRACKAARFHLQHAVDHAIAKDDVETTASRLHQLMAVTPTLDRCID